MSRDLYTKPLQQKPTHKQWRAYLLHETGQSNIRANRPNKALPDIPSCSATRVGGWVGGKTAATSADTQATVLQLGPTDPTPVHPLNTTSEYVEEG